MKPGRNDPCPCGSGKKYKRCCGLEAVSAASPQSVNPLEIGALVELINRNPNEAENGARALLARHPNEGMLWKILGVALLRQGKDALAALRRTTELMPNDAEAHSNLGAALHDREQWAESLVSLRRALAIQPHDAQALVDSADAFKALGKFEEAVASYRQALIFNPTDVQALNNLGNVLRDLGERREAISAYTRAVEIEPQRAESHCNLGNALLDFQKIDEATASLRRALALKPEYALAHLSLATALRLQRRAGEAEESCRAALALDPNNVEALSLLGELRADGGQFSEAEQSFRRAIAIDPNFAFGFFSIASHRKMTGDDSEWLRGAHALLAKRLPLRHEISLRYALGKYHDDVGQYDEAFEHYRLANELTQRYEPSYDRGTLTRRIDEIILNFDAAFFHRYRTLGSSSDRPVFIIGMPRSGTSLTEQILASHPAVFGAGELTFWDAAFLAYKKARQVGEAGPELIPAMAREYLDRLQDLSPGALRVVDKMPANFFHAGLIHAAFPNARIIHMQRHPLDTCLSIYFQNFYNTGPYANDLDNLAYYYGEYRRIMSHWRGVLPATTLLDVPYEALIGDQESWSRKMVDFIGLPWDPRCLDFHTTNRVVITTSKWQVRQKIHAASAGRWKHYEKFLGPLRHLLNPAPEADSGRLT
jgi:tetratricopeptide (TPR) repeat protein